MLPWFSPKRYCFYFFIISYQRTKPNSFLSLICLKSVRKHRRSLRKLLDAILCKSFRSPQSIVENFSKFLILCKLLGKYLQKRKLISQKQLNFSLSRVDTKFWLSTNNSFKDLPLFFFFCGPMFAIWSYVEKKCSFSLHKKWPSELWRHCSPCWCRSHHTKMMFRRK